MLILFPIDSTTVFLEEIIIYLYKKVHSSYFGLLKIEATPESRNNALTQIQNTSFDTILYLGHGTSNMLGTMNNLVEHQGEVFLRVEDFKIFQGKKLLLLSCNSGQLLFKTRKYGYKEGIGFGDLPTDWHDISSAREFDMNAYKGITDDTIKDFKNCIVDIIKWCIIDCLNKKLHFKDLYNLIILRINKQITSFFKEDARNFGVLNDILYTMKKDIYYLNNN